MATRSRPAQGNNSGPLHRPRPAYKPSKGLQVVSSGSVSKPRDTKWAKGALKTATADATPKVIQL